MSKRYRLVDHGFPFRKIVVGRKQVGRTFVANDGTFTGVIGDTKFEGADNHLSAFQGVVSRHLGFASHTALAQHNQRIRAIDRTNKQKMNAIMNCLFSNDPNEMREAINRFLAKDGG